jgi:DNA-binding LacI/PurR family transcriptional regulator
MGVSHPTIHDVAARARVSKSLVSMVIRGVPGVSDRRRQAVLRAARELGYRPNAVARSLVQQRSHALGVLLSDMHNPYFAELVDGIQDAAEARGYRALFITGNRMPRREAEAIETMLELRVDGLILAAPVVSPAEVAVASRLVPVVLVSRATRAQSVDSVTNDDRAGGILAVDHLVSLGHRRIAHIDGGSRAPGADARRTGYLTAMRRSGLGRHARVVRGSYTEEGGAEGVRAVLARGMVPTALFVANDLAAVGALHALEASGLRVPADVSLVGYDNTSLAGLGHIDLTTIDQPRRTMGGMAVSLLLERMNDGRGEARHIVLPPHLVVRRTTAAPPRGTSGSRSRIRSAVTREVDG